MADLNRPYYLTQYDHLGEDGFPDFLHSILKEIFGPSLTPFGKGKDGGRDATYEGIPKRYEKIEGFWVFQYKFHELGRVGNSSARSSIKKELPKEIEKMLNRPKKPDCYILITNAELYSSNFGDWLDTEIRGKYGPKFRYLDIWDSKRLAMWLQDPDLSKLRETFLPRTTVNLQEVGNLIRKELVREHYPFEALNKIKSAIYSHNFEWYDDTIRKYYNLVNHETKRELAEITLTWLRKYPDRSKDIFETLCEIFKPIDLSLENLLHESLDPLENYSLEAVGDLLLQLVENFQSNHDGSRLKRVSEFIITRFDLISDNSGYSFRTPPNIYSILKKLNPRIFDVLKIVPQLSNQFSKRSGEVFKGYEIMGGGTSQSASEFSVSELAIVDIFLAPSIKENYTQNPSDTWTKIEDGILTRRVSKSNPSWLLRSTIQVLLERLAHNDTEQEAKDHLMKLIQYRRGLPSFSDKIFHLLRSDVDHYATDVLVELIEGDISKYRTPTNVFVVILLFELMKRKNHRAKEVFLGLLENDKYLSYDCFEYQTLAHFHFIVNQPDLKIQIISKLLDSEIWRKKAEQEHGKFTVISDLPLAFQGAAVETAILNNGNLNFLDEFLQDKTDDLRRKIVFESLSEIAKRYPGETYSFIKNHLENQQRVEEFIKDTSTRIKLVRVGDELAQKSMGKEALWIIHKFINDPDPQLDEEGSFNYHNRIEAGEDVNVISTVRGNVPWVLQKLAVNKEFTIDAFHVTRDLVQKEDNLYVIQQCIVPLIEVATRAGWLEALDKLNEFRDSMFDILRKYSRYPAIGHLLTSVFIPFRDLNENDAEEAIRYLGYVPDFAPFIIHYALSRKNMFKEKWEFKSERFEKILKNMIRNGNDDVRRQIAWHFWKILGSRKSQFSKLKEYVDEYVSSHYSREAFYFL